MFKIKLSVFASAWIFVGSAFAARDICPELSAIQAEGISMSKQIEGFYCRYQISNFDKDFSWAFVMAPFNVASNEETIINC